MVSCQGSSRDQSGGGASSDKFHNFPGGSDGLGGGDSGVTVNEGAGGREGLTAVRATGGAGGLPSQPAIRPAAAAAPVFKNRRRLPGLPLDKGGTAALWAERG